MDSKTGGNQNLDLVQQWENENFKNTGNPPNSDLVHRWNQNNFTNNESVEWKEHAMNQYNSLNISDSMKVAKVNALVNILEKTSDHVQAQKKIRDLAHQKLEAILENF